MEQRKVDKYLVKAEVLEQLVGVINELPAKHVRKLINELEQTTQPVYDSKPEENKNNDNRIPVVSSVPGSDTV